MPSEIVALVCVLGIGFVSMAVVLWKANGTLSEMTGRHVRFAERERTQFFQMYERLVEQRDRPSDRTQQLHATERIQETREQAETERAVSKFAESPPIDGEKWVDPSAVV